MFSKPLALFSVCQNLRPACRIDLDHAGVAHGGRLSLGTQAEKALQNGGADVPSVEFSDQLPLSVGNGETIYSRLYRRDRHVNRFAIPRPYPIAPREFEFLELVPRAGLRRIQHHARRFLGHRNQVFSIRRPGGYIKTLRAPHDALTRSNLVRSRHSDRALKPASPMHPERYPAFSCRRSKLAAALCSRPSPTFPRGDPGSESRAGCHR
jgi:hypothetical protein